MDVSVALEEESGPSGGGSTCTHVRRHFHGGFLKGVRDDAELHHQLRKALRRGCCHLYICGHSLGGSLALALASAGLLPEDYTGPVTVVALGSPPVSQAAALPPAPPEASPPPSPPADGEAPADAPRRATPRYVLVVNECDVVPRLLGSPMPVATAALLAASARGAKGGGSASATASAAAQAVTRRNVELMETMQQYAHPRATETILLRDGSARAVNTLASLYFVDLQVSSAYYYYYYFYN